MAPEKLLSTNCRKVSICREVKVLVNRKIRSLVLIGLAFLVAASGCTAHRAGTFTEDFSARPVNFAVGAVENQTGESFEVDVPQLYKEALQSALADANLLAGGNPESAVTLNTQITEYQKGSAVKRWIVPGWGSTVFAVQVNLKDSGGQDLGSVTARRSVGFGGLLTIGAWKKIVSDIAQDVVAELRQKINLVK